MSYCILKSESQQVLIIKCYTTRGEYCTICGQKNRLRVWMWWKILLLTRAPRVNFGKLCKDKSSTLVLRNCFSPDGGVIVSAERQIFTSFIRFVCYSGRKMVWSTIHDLDENEVLFTSILPKLIFFSRYILHLSLSNYIIHYHFKISEYILLINCMILILDDYSEWSPGHAASSFRCFHISGSYVCLRHRLPSFLCSSFWNHLHHWYFYFLISCLFT